MVQALDDGRLTIQDTGWQIGDERTVQLSAMEATGVGESHAAQTVTLVLMDSGHYDLTTPTVGGDTKDHFVVGLKNCLNENGYMNSTNTTVSWNGCARRIWCNNVFREALPSAIKGCFKQFQCLTAQTYDGSTNKVSNDYFALFAEKEIFGYRSYSNGAEAEALTQIAYYTTPANRIKKVGGSDSSWWERSPYSRNYGWFCLCGVSGSSSTANWDTMNTPRGLAPFGCI